LAAFFLADFPVGFFLVVPFAPRRPAVLAADGPRAPFCGAARASFFLFAAFFALRFFA
jgi:hypothetical protein